MKTTFLAILVIGALATPAFGAPLATGAAVPLTPTPLNAQPYAVHPRFATLKHGIIPTIFGIGTALVFLYAGSQLQGITSVSASEGSTTTAEEFYHGMGVACYGMAGITILQVML